MTHFARADEPVGMKALPRSYNVSMPLPKDEICPAHWLIPPLFYAIRKHMPIGSDPASCFTAHRRLQTGVQLNWIYIRQ